MAEEKVDIWTIDFDGCYCNPLIISELGILIPKLREDKSIPPEEKIQRIVEVFERNNKDFPMLEKAHKVNVGSNRQDVFIDQLNSNDHIHGVSSYAIYKAAFGEKLNQLLLADAFLEQDPGTHMNDALKELNDGFLHHDKSAAFMEKPVPFDELKVGLIYFQMHAAAHEYPDKEIDFTFVDDRDDIIRTLHEFFEENPQTIPPNVTLNLINHYYKHEVQQMVTEATKVHRPNEKSRLNPDYAKAALKAIKTGETEEHLAKIHSNSVAKGAPNKKRDWRNLFRRNHEKKNKGNVKPQDRTDFAGSANATRDWVEVEDNVAGIDNNNDKASGSPHADWRRNNAFTYGWKPTLERNEGNSAPKNQQGNQNAATDPPTDGKWAGAMIGGSSDPTRKFRSMMAHHRPEGPIRESNSQAAPNGLSSPSSSGAQHPSITTSKGAIPNTLLKYTEKDGTRVIAVLGQKYPMYQSTGKNSGQGGTFFPFSGIMEKDVPGYTKKGVFAKPSFDVYPISKILQERDNQYFPETLIQYINEQNVDKETMQRMGNIECLAISSEIGGGYWNTEEGKDLKTFIEDQFPDYMNGIRETYKDDIKALASIDQIPKNKFETITDPVDINEKIKQEIKEHEIGIHGDPRLPDGFKIKDMPESTTDYRHSM